MEAKPAHAQFRLGRLIDGVEQNQGLFRPNRAHLTSDPSRVIIVLERSQNALEILFVSEWEHSQMASEKKFTIEDVAKLSGVSRGTVSRVLNGGLNVKPETKRRVLETIERLGYEPNRHARRFAGSKSYTVSVILPMIGTDFYAHLIDGIEQELADQWYDPVLFPLLTRERLARFLRPNNPVYQMDGVILCSLLPERLYPTGHLPTDRPVVLVETHSPAYDSVYLDNELGGYIVGRHLIQSEGEVYVILVREELETPFASGIFHERLRGFERALEEAGRELDSRHIITVDFSWGGGCLASREILERSKPPLNIFASCDILALGVTEEVIRAGLQLGKDVRIVGFDDLPWAAEWGITTVRQPIEEMGKTAAQLLLERLRGDKSPVREVRFTPELVVRESA